MPIVAKELSKTFFQANQQIEIFKNINFIFENNVTYALTGVSGSGKTTLLNLLSGLDTPTSGQVLFSPSTNSPSQRKKLSIGMVFQDDYLIEELTVFENIAIAGLAQNLNKKEIAINANKLISRVGLEDKINSFPYQLSGGQRSRASLCRALVCSPDFLLADEPSGNLDKENAQKIADLICELHKQLHMGVIICTHDQNIYRKMKVVLKIENGTLFHI